MLLRKATFLLAASLASAASASAAVIINQAVVMAGANDGAGALGYTTSLYGTALPLGPQIATDGTASASTTISVAGTGDQLTFTFDLQHERTGLLASTYTQANLNFRPTANLSFDLSGLVTVTDASGAPGFAMLVVEMQDTGSFGYTYNNYQVSDATANETFNLTSLGGDYFNESNGSTSGTLLANHNYALVFGVRSYALHEGDNASVNASFTLKLGGGAPVASVPDSATSAGLVTLGLASLAGLAALRRRMA